MFMYAGPHISLCTIVNSVNRRERLFFLAGWVGRNWLACLNCKRERLNINYRELEGKTKDE